MENLRVVPRCSCKPPHSRRVDSMCSKTPLTVGGVRQELAERTGETWRGFGGHADHRVAYAVCRIFDHKHRKFVRFREIWLENVQEETQAWPDGIVLGGGVAVRDERVLLEARPGVEGNLNVGTSYRPQLIHTRFGYICQRVVMTRLPGELTSVHPLPRGFFS